MNDTVTVANTAPVAGTVTITPASPTTNQTLTATPAGFTDADGDSLTYHYQWFNNGSPLAGETSSTLDLSVAGNGNRGDLIKVEVYATDGNAGTSSTVNDTVTVANTAPVAGTVTITPASPTTNQTLTATPAGFTDADGDSLTYHYQWFNNGSPLAGETSSTLDLSVAGNGNRGDLIKVEVYATDGNAGTSSTVNDTVTVANTAPVAGTVTITPASPTTNQTLTATPAGFTDADGDSLTYHYQWFNNGSPLAGETSSTLDLSVAGNGNRGDLIKVEVYATDGNAGTSSTVNDTVTVANTAPVAGTVTITPASPTTNQTLTATPAGFTDADGDSLTYHYQWFNNGSPLAGETSSTLDLSVAGNGNRGDLIKVEVYATDGNAGTSSTVNDTVTVANTAPVAGTVTITPASPTTNQTLTATPAGFTDADGDSLTYHYQWFNNGSPLAGETSSTLDLSVAGNGNRGDLIKVEVYATDGNAGTSSTVNDTVTVANTAPVAGTVSITPGSPETNQTLAGHPGRVHRRRFGDFAHLPLPVVRRRLAARR